MLALLWVFQIVFLNDFYKSIKIKEINSSADKIASQIDSDTLEDTLYSIAQDTQNCIMIVDRNGMVVYSEEAAPNCVIHRLPWSGLLQVFEVPRECGGTYFERFTHDNLQIVTQGRSWDSRPNVIKSEGVESMILTRIVTTKDGVEYLILLNSTITPVDATVKTLRIQLFWITGIMLLLALFLALLLSRRISKPIIRINDSAKVLATGNYGIHFEENGYREISELGHTLNYAAQELSKVETLQRDLIANVSHDLRTPLTMITGYGEVMRDLPGENTPENVQIIIDEARRLTTLVNDMLDISKLQAGVMTLEAEGFCITDEARSILQRYTKLTDYKIEFLAGEDVLVYADRSKISQVIYNLVNNAITYTGPEKNVTVYQTVHDNMVRIAVQDTGEGIPADQLKDIWNRYYKVDKEHKRAQVGTGLGLSIVKSILELHQSPFGVQSELGKGSIFWFELPIFTDD